MPPPETPEGGPPPSSSSGLQGGPPPAASSGLQGGPSPSSSLGPRGGSPASFSGGSRGGGPPSPSTGPRGGPPRASPHLWLERLCLAFAGAGGLAIFAVSMAVTASVVMRTAGVGGIRGDFEMVELACASCAALFLPLCQLKKGHVMVDIFTAWAPARAVRRIDGLWTLVFAAAWAALAWRMWEGMATMLDYGDRTMLLRFPVWWVYVPGVAGMALSAVVALESGLRQLAGLPEPGAGRAPS